MVRAIAYALTKGTKNGQVFLGLYAELEAAGNILQGPSVESRFLSEQMQLEEGVDYEQNHCPGMMHVPSCLPMAELQSG